MNIEQKLTATVIAALNTLYGQEVPEKMVQLQKTKKEFEGPLGADLDLHDETGTFGMDTWEKSESEMQRIVLNLALAKAKCETAELDAIFAGDLLNQCVGSAYGLLSFGKPFFGLYGACKRNV